MKKKMAAAGLAAGLVAGAGAGLVLELSGSAGAASPAAQSTDTTDPTGSSGSASTPAGDPAADHAAHLQEILQPLVDDGTLTQAQADAVIAALEAAGPMGGDHDGDGDHGPGMGRGGQFLATVAATLGLTEDEVRTALEGGQTLADLAAANGSSADALVAAITAEIKTHLDEEVAAGTITQDEADQRLADATQRATDMVNGTMPAGGPGMGGGMGGPGMRGHHGPDDDGDGDAPVTTDGN